MIGNVDIQARKYQCRLGARSTYLLFTDTTQTTTEVCTVSNYSAKASSLHAGPTGPDNLSAGQPSWYRDRGSADHQHV